MLELAWVLVLDLVAELQSVAVLADAAELLSQAAELKLLHVAVDVVQLLNPAVALLPTHAVVDAELLLSQAAVSQYRLTAVAVQSLLVHQFADPLAVRAAVLDRC